MSGFQSTKIFLLKDMLQTEVKKFVIKKIENTLESTLDLCNWRRNRI